MAKVRTLSRTFMKGHPKAGQPTYFVERMLRSLINEQGKAISGSFNDFEKLELEKEELERDFEKGHTIRMGRHFKPNDELTLAVWSGKPYRSKQIKLWIGPIRAIDIDVIIEEHYDELYLSLRPGHIKLKELAKNDGLSLEDFRHWFNLPVGEHAAQILIWNPEINY
jgi:hypothetical protein